MGVAKRHAFARQVIRQIGRRSVAFERRSAHGARHRHEIGDQTREYLERALHRRRGVEQRLLVFLIVLVVRQRLAFHHGEQGDEAAEHAAALAAHQLRHIRILLLRHDRGAGAVAVRQAHEAEARACPEHQLLGEARQVNHHKRRAGAELDREVAVGDGVERILGDALEPQLARHALAVDGEAGAGQRGGAERQPVDAPAAVGEALAVALEHRHVGEQVMAERDRLRHLQVRVAGHDQRGVARRLREQRALERRDELADLVDRGAQPKAQIGGHLVVARARRVQPLARVAGERREPALDGDVHVLVVGRPLEAAALDLAPHAREAALDRRHVAPGEDGAGAEHARVGERALNVVERQPLVESER